MSSTVQVGSFEISSNHESAKDMVAALTPAEKDGGKPVVKVDSGKAVEPEKAKASEAARELGKRGGEAAAKAREAREKEAPKEKAEPAPEKVTAGREEPAEADEEEAEQPEKQSRARQRVEQATRQLAEERRLRAQAESRAQAVEDRLARLERGEPKDAPVAKQEAPSADGKPKVDDYATYEEWVDALTDWKAETKISEREKRYAQQAQEQAAVESFTKRGTSFFERVEKGAGGKEGMEEVLPLLQALHPRSTLDPQEWARMSAHAQAASDLADEVMDSERPYEILLHLKRNPEVFQALVSSPNAYALRRALGRIEGVLDREEQGEAAPAPEPRRSSAPPPLRPLSPSVQPGEVDLTEDMDFDTFAKKAARRKR